MKFKALFAAVVILSSVSCKKDSYQESEEEKVYRLDINAATSILAVEVVLNEIEFFVRQAPAGEPSGILSCATVNKQTVEGGERIEIGFTAESPCSDNTTRSGRLILNYQSATGNVLVMSDNYSTAGLKVLGNYNFENITEQGQSLLKLTVANAQLNAITGDYVKFSGERKNSFKEGKASASLNDDVFETQSERFDLEVKGSSQVTLIESEITQPLILKYSCEEKFRPRAGKLKFSRESGLERVISFGSGGCNDQPVMN